MMLMMMMMMMMMIDDDDDDDDAGGGGGWGLRSLNCESSSCQSVISGAVATTKSDSFRNK